jgi:hypothetical protein
MTRWLVILALLVACGEPPAPAPSKQAVRPEAPTVARFTFSEGALLVIEVQVREMMFGEVESHRCFVWRDAEYRIAALSCPQPAEPAGTVIRPGTGDEPFHP